MTVVGEMKREGMGGEGEEEERGRESKRSKGI